MKKIVLTFTGKVGPYRALFCIWLTDWLTDCNLGQKKAIKGLWIPKMKISPKRTKNRQKYLQPEKLHHALSISVIVKL